MLSIFNPFFRWWLKKGRYPWSRFRRIVCEFRYRNKKLPTATSLEEIEGRLKEVTWTMDGLFHLFDAISLPQTVWCRKKDDCDGFSILAATLLNGWNKDCKPVLLTVLMWPMKKSHTVCAFKKSAGELSYFDNYTLKEGSYQNYAEIASIVKRDYELICWDIADPETLRTKEFHRTL